MDKELYYISPCVIDILTRNFDLKYLLTKKDFNSSDAHLGYMKGVNDVLNYIKFMIDEQNDIEIGGV